MIRHKERIRLIFLLSDLPEDQHARRSDVPIYIVIFEKPSRKGWNKNCGKLNAYLRNLPEGLEKFRQLGVSAREGEVAHEKSGGLKNSFFGWIFCFLGHGYVLKRQVKNEKTLNAKGAPLLFLFRVLSHRPIVQTPSQPCLRSQRFVASSIRGPTWPLSWQVPP